MVPGTTIITAALFGLVLLSSIGSAEETVSVMCVCRCCYQGDCAPMSNASWKVESCSDCKTSLCNTYVASSEARSKAARLFDSLESTVPEAAVEGTDVDVCQIVTVLEVATCSGSRCKRSTNLKAECYNRDAPIMKYSIQAFVAICIVATFIGLIKNHIPAFQEFNAKYFNY